MRVRVPGLGGPRQRGPADKQPGVPLGSLTPRLLKLTGRTGAHRIRLTRVSRNRGDMSLLLSILVALGPQLSSAKTVSDAAQPFTRIWRYETPSIIDVRAAADAEIVILPLTE